MAKEKTTRKPRAKAPEGETKEQKFVRLANMRVPKIIKALQNLGNLSGSGYARTADQVERIETAIDAAFTAAIDKLKATPAAKKGENLFKL